MLCIIYDICVCLSLNSLGSGRARETRAARLVQPSQTLLRSQLQIQSPCLWSFATASRAGTIDSHMYTLHIYDVYIYISYIRIHIDTLIHWLSLLAKKQTWDTVLPHSRRSRRQQARARTSTWTELHWKSDIPQVQKNGSQTHFPASNSSKWDQAP